MQNRRPRLNPREERRGEKDFKERGKKRDHFSNVSRNEAEGPSMLIAGLIKVSMLQLWESEESCQLSRGFTSWSWSRPPAPGFMCLSHHAQHSVLYSALLVMETIWRKQKFWILFIGDQRFRPWYTEESGRVSQPALNWTQLLFLK